MIEKCPKCGADLDEAMTNRPAECPSCGVIFEKFAKHRSTPPSHGLPPKKKELRPTPTIENPTSAKPTVSKLAVWIVVAVVASAALFFAYSTYANKKSEEEYSAVSAAVANELIQLAIGTESVVDEIVGVWRDAIFSDYEKRDFNEAIVEVHSTRSNEIALIEKMSASISQQIKAMDPPEGKERDYQRLKEIYLLFDKYSTMAVSPAGSLQSYSEQNNELKLEIKTAIRELEMMH